MRRISAEVAAVHAADVDARGRFPSEVVAALKAEGLMAIGVPAALGGAGVAMRELAELCAVLGEGCGSSAMVFAMHHIQLACIARHGMDAPFFRGFMATMLERQLVLASITSEVGTYGDTRSSICAVERDGDRFRLIKEATTGSYCAHADAILVTCRRDADAPPSDQILVLVQAGDYELAQTSTWDSLGMRGTCSPGFRLESAAAAEQILPGAFADSAARSMVPYSHILWSALWQGITAAAVARAASFVRAAARKAPGTMPPAATRLAHATARLQAMRCHWQAVASEFDALDDGGEALTSIKWALELNQLKLTMAEAAPQVVHEALQVVGIAGYKNDSPYSVGRHYRDVLSASLMISNDRVAAKSAALLLVHKDA